MKEENVAIDIANQNEDEGIVAPMWGGHFARPNVLVNKVTSGFHKRLYITMLESTLAQVRMLAKTGIISQEHANKITNALRSVKRDFTSDKFEIINSISIYSDLSDRMSNLLTPEEFAGFKIACGYADQRAGDLKVWLRGACESTDEAIQNLQAALIDKAEENVKTLVPGYVHSQSSQPSSLGYSLLSYIEMLGRDRARIQAARKHMNISPYNVGDLAASSMSTKREITSKLMGFDTVVDNALDAVSDRDFIIEYLSAASTAAMHLSRIAQDLLNLHDSKCRIISFSDEFVRQHDVLPSRRDPIALEAVRAKAGKIYGALMNALITLKGLPTMYTADLDEMSEALFEAYDSLINSLNVMAAMVADFIVYKKVAKGAASRHNSTSIDVLHWAMENLNMNVDEARELTNKLVELSIAAGKKFSLLELSELQALHSGITDDIYSVFIPSRAIIKRRSGGGTNPVQVRKAIRAAKSRYL